MIKYFKPFLHCLVIASLQPLIGADAVGQRYESSIETDHFVIKWNEIQTEEEEVDSLAFLSEEIIEKYGNYLGDDKLPKGRLIIYMGGPGFDRKTNKLNIPRVNRDGEIFIYRFADYFGELAHEIFHAFRVFKGNSNDWFLEEGLAECLVSLLFPDHIGFCRYGYSTTITAGAWLNSQKLIPLGMLKERHSELNITCQAQSYAIRADFFRYLEMKFGKSQLMNFAYSPRSSKLESYEYFFGKSLEQLEKEWLSDLSARLAEEPNAEMLIKQYLSQTPVQNMKVCEPADF